MSDAGEQASSPPTFNDLVRAHLLAHLGSPSRTAEFSRGSRTVEVYKWSKGSTAEGVHLYATNGASHLLREHDSTATHLNEFILGLSSERDGVAAALAGLAFFETEYHERLGSDDTVPVDGATWPGAPFNAFAVRAQVHEIVPDLLQGSAHVAFLTAIPLYPSELDFARRHSTAVLLQHWERSFVPFWDPARPDSQQDNCG